MTPEVVVAILFSGIGLGIWGTLMCCTYVCTDNKRWYQSMLATQLAAQIPLWFTLWAWLR